ncbi:MAG: glycosyltransferase family 2 protein, partial [Candidatus Brocadiales bacterium]
MKPTISIIIPALNEEDNIEPAVNKVISALDGRFSDYELLVFDDGSTDNTGAIIDRLAGNDKNVRAIHNENNMGLGYSYKKGVQLAKNDYIVMFPGDNQILKDSM